MNNLKFDQNGLLTGVVQDKNTKEILMVAMMNAKAVALTSATRKAYFWSRSRKKIWLKGETSGNFLEVVSMKVDCDGDALLLEVVPAGPACHTGNRSCFFSEFGESHAGTII